MALTPQHTYQVLTKRPERLERMFNRTGLDGRCPAPGAWFKSPLRPRPASSATRSDSPAPPAGRCRTCGSAPRSSPTSTFGAPTLSVWFPAFTRFLSLEPLLGPLPSLNLTGIDWVIVGGESGPGHRPVDLGWVREIRDRCLGAGVAFFFKPSLHQGLRLPDVPSLRRDRASGGSGSCACRESRPR